MKQLAEISIWNSKNNQKDKPIFIECNQHGNGKLVETVSKNRPISLNLMTDLFSNVLPRLTLYAINQQLL